MTTTTTNHVLHHNYHPTTPASSHVRGDNPSSPQQHHLPSKSQQQRSTSPTPPPVYFSIPIVGFFRSQHTTTASSNSNHNHNHIFNNPLNEQLPLYDHGKKGQQRRFSQSMRNISTCESQHTTQRQSKRQQPVNEQGIQYYGSTTSLPVLRRHHSERPSPSYYSKLYQESLVDVSSLSLQESSSVPITTTTPPLLEQSSDTNRTTQPHHRRTAKELWNIIRFHVHHETFHIDSAYWYHSDKTDTTTTKKNRHDNECDSLLLFTQSPYENHNNFNEMMDLPYDFTIRDCIIALVIYLCISIMAYSYIFERWSIIDSMYFACVSFTTIGYGDLSPTTPGGRFFCIFFALSGVAILAIALGVLGSNIIENEVKAMESAKHKIFEKIMSKLPKKVIDNPKVLLHSSSSDGEKYHPSSSFNYLRDFDDPTIHDDYDDSNIVSQKMKQIHEYCTLFTQLMCRYIPSLLPLFIGSLIIGRSEGWSIIDSIYYCVVTTTTIGYGDRVPQHESMKLFAVLFIPLSVGAMGHFLGTIANFIIEQRRKAYDKQLWKHELTIQDLYSMNDTGVVTELDFVIFMLQAMKKVDRELIDHIRHHFHVLDVTNSNTLCRDDLEFIAKKKLRSVKTKLRMSAYRKRILKSSSHSFNYSNDDVNSKTPTTPLNSFD